MNLSIIPSSILSEIRRLSFSFLWTGAKKTEGIHLSNWESLAKPYRYGGCGLKHVPIFNHALNAKSL